jgi:hypothetical protein
MRYDLRYEWRGHGDDGEDEQYRAEKHSEPVRA